MRFLSILVLILSTWAVKVKAQTYPVQVHTQIAPPYTPYLSDYTAAGAQRFMVNMLLNDPTLPEYRCRLRLTIEGVGITIRTKQNFIPQPLVLSGGGIPSLLYGEDLIEYFNPNHLDFSGITRKQYEQGAKLPEGLYRFTVEVLDYNRGSVVSNKGTSIAWIVLNDPPLLNLPRTNSKVNVIDPTNIAFTWTPRHTGSPNSAFTTHYVFRLVEVWPATRNPYDAFLSQPPLYEVTTNFTQIVYGAAEPALIPGRKYAWQVQAKDVEERDLFKNQGRSEVYVFQFGDALGAPEGLYLQTANPTSLVVRWEQSTAGMDVVKYRVRYRPRNDRRHEGWYEEHTEDQWKALPQLQPNTEYEVQVRAEQLFQVSEYSPVEVFKTGLPGANDFACKSGVSPPPIPANKIPAFRLGLNDTIHAGGYDVLVREITAATNGTYTGSGMAIVPWFNSAKVRVTFKNINVNEQHWLTAGEINSVWNPDSKFLLNTETKTNPASTPTTGELPVTVVATETLIEITGAAIVTVTKNEAGEIEIYTSDGQSQKLEKGRSYSIVDEVGNGYVVDKDGNITKTTATEARAAAGRGDRNYTITLRFGKGAGKFGFDEKKYDALAPYYQQLDGGQYTSWKAVTASRADPVAATLEGTDIDPKKVRFEVNGSPVASSMSGQRDYSLSLLGKAAGTVEELLALYAPSDTAKDNVLGKLNLVSYDEVTHNLVIVPVNGASLPGGLTGAALSQKLTEIYGQAVIDWSVRIDPPVKVSLNETFDDGESGLLTNYTSDMKKVIKAYGDLQDKTYYLFLVNKPKSGNSLGYMPRSKQAGFIFVDKLNSTNAVTTIAHELGHGAFNLKHTFSEFPSLSKGSTDNLMDYGNGAALYKHQWDHVHDPQRAIPLFEDDEEGAHTGVREIPEFLMNKTVPPTLTFVTPAGSLIVLPYTASGLVFTHGFENLDGSYVTTGTLHSFTYDGTEYSMSPISSRVFDGYHSSKGKYNWPIASEDLDKVTAAALMVLPCNNAVNIYQFRNSGLSIDDGSAKEMLEEKYFPLKPFSEANKLVNAKSYTVKEFAQLVEGDDHRFNITDHENEMISKYCGKPELLPVLKLAQLRNVYPTLFSHFEAAVNGLAYPDMAAIDNLCKDIYNTIRTSKGNTDSFQYEIIVMEGFREYIKRRLELNSTFKPSLSLQTTTNELNLFLTGFGISDYENLTIEDRVLILRIATKGLIVSGPLENAVRNVITYTPDEDKVKMLDRLQREKDGKDKKFLLQALCEDWSGLDGAQFTETISAIVEWIFAAFPVPHNFIDYALESSVSSDNAKAIRFKPGLWGGAVLQEKFLSNGDVVLKSRQQFTQNVVTVISRPYEYVLVEIDDENFVIKNTTLKGGGIIKVPAIYAYLLFNNENTSRLIKAGKIVLDAALFYVGVGEIRAALQTAKSFRYYRAIADVGLSVTDFTINNILETSLQRSPGGQEFLSAWNQLMLIYGVSSISEAVLQQYLNSLRRAADKIIKEGKLYDVSGNLVHSVNSKDVDDLNKLVNDFEAKTGMKAVPEVVVLDKMKMVGSYEEATQVLTLTSNDLNKVIDELPASYVAVGEYDVKVIHIDDADYSLSFKAKMIEENGVVKCYVDGGYCFPAGTPVWNSKGGAVDIATLEKGDRVMTYDHHGEATRVSRVVNIVKRTAHRLTKLVIGGALLLATPEHPLYANGKYTEAQHVQPGDSILTNTGLYAKIQSSVTHDTTAIVYNIEVAGDHNFFVGAQGLLVHNSCGWLTIKSAASDKALFKTFHDNIINLSADLKLTPLQRKEFYDAIASLPNSADFISDFARDVDALRIFVENSGLVDSWKLLDDAGRIGLKTNVNALEALNGIRKNTKLADLKITDDMLIKIEGISNVSYAQILDDLDIAIKALPEGKVIDFHKVVSDGQRGLVNSNNVWDRRHSWLTLKKIKENEPFLKNVDEVKFEVELETIDGISNAVPDIVITKSGTGGTTKKIIGEVKAGDNVITANFNSQSLRYFQEIADIRDLRLFRRDGVPLTKQQVIDSWRNGGVLGNTRVKNLFEKFDEDVVKSGFDAQTDVLEDFLKKDDSWFNTIFNSSF